VRGIPKAGARMNRWLTSSLKVTGQLETGKNERVKSEKGEISKIR
jgi:hypothetical protein